MLVDINLLPIKEKTSLTSTILIIVAVIMLLGATTWLGLDYYVSTGKLQEKERLLQQEKLIVQTEQKREQANRVIDSAPLVEKIEYIQGKEIAAADLLQHLVALLPERGYFMKYEYQDKKTVNIEVRFDTLADTSHYLHELTNSPYLTEAAIEKMETTNFEEINEGKDMTAFENILPRYHSLYKIEFQKDKILELKGDKNEGE
ncbi:PilN domain-containing protein [Fictibacillus halophilus]|uniref:PilN domain-containing protein n=1 Tax=Fictibacillus halophilus TaxID=1610490 RepID=UPI001CFB602D|nr:PilN domain-containing protein [Fictibacillus halophilus]